MAEKIKCCFKCMAEKALSDFYPHPRMADGHLNKCKDCTKADMALHRLNDLDKARDQDRQRNSRGIRRTWICWRNMLARCEKHDNKQYQGYGGRGIKVCDRWRASFENFLADMGERPKGLTLDRIDNDGDYEPANCRWATKTDQARNRRTSRWIELDGERRVLRDWAGISGIDDSLICYHLKRGRSLASIFTRRGYQHTAPNSNGDSLSSRGSHAKTHISFEVHRHPATGLRPRRPTRASATGRTP